MRRRQVITLIGGAAAAAAWPLAARAQQREPLRRVAILVPIAADTPGAQAFYTAFLKAFEQLGWTDGRNVQIVVRWGGGDEAKTRKYAEELVALAPDEHAASRRRGPSKNRKRASSCAITRRAIANVRTSCVNRACSRWLPP